LDLENVFDTFPKYHMTILLGYIDVKVGKEDVFKPTIVKERLHEINNDNGVAIVNSATSENLKSKVPCSHIVAFVNLLGRLQMRKPTIRLTIF
jgi:hypothetical protein